MAKRGPKPQATALKKLRGNPGKRALNDSEPTPKVESPSCPDWLDRDGRDTWRWLVENLETLGILAKCDQALMALYCDTWSQLCHLRRRRADKGEAQFLAPTKAGGFYRHPLFDVEATLKKQLAAYLGDRPSSRTRIRVDMQKGDDPITEMLKSRMGLN